MEKVDFSRLWGNDAVTDMLKTKLRQGESAHAYLIAGPAGSGKKTLAFLIAAAMCCEDDGTVPCFSCPSCRKLLSANSPDLTMLGVEALPFSGGDIPAVSEAPKTIGVDAVRALQTDVYIKPNDLDYKIYIIGHADRMTVQAQNALLKILEEPPQGVVFLLLCENRTALLPTVRSRVQTLSTEIFNDTALYRYLTEHDKAAKTLAAKDPDKLRLFIRLSGGTVGCVRQYMQSDTKTLAADPVYEAHETAARCLAVMFAGEHVSHSPVLSGGDAQPLPRKTALYEILSTRAGTREQLRFLMDTLSAALRDILMCVYSEEDTAACTLLFYADAAQPRALAQTVSPVSIASASTALAALRAALDSNPNTALVTARLAEILMRVRF